MDFDPAAIIQRPTSTTQAPLRIAVVTETYPPEVNGVAATLARTVQALRERGNGLQLIRPRQHLEDQASSRDGFQEVLADGMPLPRYPHLRLGFPARRRLTQLWRNAQPDVVHIATEGPLGWSAIGAARSLGIPTVSEFRTNFDTYTRYYGVGWLGSPIRAYLRLFHNRTGCTMAPTKSLAADLVARGFRNVSVVGRGVDTRLFTPDRRDAELRRTWGASDRTLVALSVGRIAPEKNLDALKAAYEAMRFVNRDVLFVVVGDGPSKAEFEARCPGAILAGVRRDEDLARHYASADIMLFPSLTETYGNVTPEAMASGLAVIAYDYAAAAQLIRHGESGWLAGHGSRPDFVRLATEAAMDVDSVRRIGTRARSTSLQMSWHRIAAEVEAHYRAVIHGRTPLRGANPSWVFPTLVRQQRTAPRQPKRAPVHATIA